MMTGILAATQPATTALGTGRSLLHRLFFFEGNSDLAPAVDWLFMFILWVCIVSFVVLMVPMGYWVWRYRRRPGVPAQRTPNHNTAIEVAMVVIPLIVVVFIFFWGFQGYLNSVVAKGRAEVINIEGYKWAWDATYANGAKPGDRVYLNYEPLEGDPSLPESGPWKLSRGNYAMPVIAVPEATPVQFVMTSRDVIHSFYIPDARIKMDVFPNRYTSLTFTPVTSKGPDQAGRVQPGADPSDPYPGRDHYIFCAEYCGDNHSEMLAVLRVMSDSDYSATLARWADVEKDLSLAELGAYVHQFSGCAQCHTVDGSRGTGPSWAPVKDAADGGGVGWGSVAPLADGGEALIDENYVRQSVRYPGAQIHRGYANQMPVYGPDKLSDRQLLGVIAYMRELAGKATPEDRAKPQTPQ